MKAERPSPALIPQLRALWKEAFGDTDAFLDLFFSLGYDPDRCRCIRSQDRVTAALYWLDVFADGQKLAYIYAVATARDFRGQGLCRQLMAETAEALQENGYHGALLVPQSEGLRAMYGRMRFLDAAPIEEFFCAAADRPVPMEEITAKQYASRRSAYLPEGSVQPGTEAFVFLSKLACFFAGKDFLAAVGREPEHLRILEYLGGREQLPGLIAALGATEATVRSPGTGRPFAMYLPLRQDSKAPVYYPFAFD